MIDAISTFSCNHKCVAVTGNVLVTGRLKYIFGPIFVDFIQFGPYFRFMFN